MSQHVFLSSVALICIDDGRVGPLRKVFSSTSFQALTTRWTVLNPGLVVSAISSVVFLMQANNLTLLKQSNVFSTTTGHVF
ncbi:hypothetical protein LDENG_00275570 [Lucifuga dentata]|nr:hypothetical protein LDENG_00275570 [Lucifuga dentata]